MKKKRVLLTLSEKILKELKKEKEDFGYNSIQEVILDILREKLFKNKTEKETRGRPKKFDAVKFLTSKKPMFK